MTSALPRTLALLAVLLLAVGPSAAQDARPGPVPPDSLEQGFILVVQDRSGLTGIDAIYVGSNQVNWNPADPAMRLQPRSDQRWQIVMPGRPGDERGERAPLEFKLTRGSWDTVEVAADLSDVVNRRLAPIDASRLKPGEQPVIELVVEKWADQRPEAQARKAVDTYRALKVTGDVRRIQVPGGGGVPLIRDLLVWLPPGYDDPRNKDRRYPVLYMQDGQNLFEKHPAIPGEWRVDETATELIDAGRIEPLIIVGIPHAGPFRVSEYAPVPGFKGVEPKGEQYVAWLVERVMPRVSAAFRIAEGPENTAIGGSSLGALVALHAATQRPEVFGKVLAESPALGFAERPVVEAFRQAKGWPRRTWIAMGERETGPDAADAGNRRHVEAVRALAALMHESGVSDSAVRMLIDPEGTHDENTWARRLPRALEFLFPPAGER